MKKCINIRKIVRIYRGTLSVVFLMHGNIHIIVYNLAYPGKNILCSVIHLLLILVGMEDNYEESQ
jgi:hypothetical protein